MNKLLMNLPATAGARLPQTYEAARTQLAECERIDECKSWADKAEALKSYAKQAGDTQLRHMAERIQLRAIRRCGELLKAIEENRGRPSKIQEGTLPNFGRTQAAREAGLSEHQQKTAVRMANVPDADFEQAVESADPVTVTELAERGTQKRVVIDHLQGRDPEEFQMAMYVGGDLRRMAETAGKTDPAAFSRGIDSAFVPETIAQIHKIQAWLSRLVTALETENVQPD